MSGIVPNRPKPSLTRDFGDTPGAKATNEYCCVARGIRRYGFNAAGGNAIAVAPASGPATGTILDQASGNNTLDNRISLTIHNVGASDCEISLSQKWTYGDGASDVVKAGTAISIDLGPSSIVGSHYALCVNGGTCDLRITELGAEL